MFERDKITIRMEYIDRDNNRTTLEREESPEDGVSVSLETLVDMIRDFSSAIGYFPDSIDKVFNESE